MSKIFKENRLRFGISGILFCVLTLYTLPQEDFTEEPPFIRDSILPFSQITDIQIRKQVFIDYMRPIIDAENKRVMTQRYRLIGLYDQFLRNQPIKGSDKAWLGKLVTEYKVLRADSISHRDWVKLIKRVDEIPLTMALAQSAVESGWGTSRFAQLGNSLFGQWTYTKTNGIVPKDRKKGATHRVAQFDSVRDSVRSYMRNLNTHAAYDRFRLLRFEQRLKGQPLDGYQLAAGIERYSQRRQAYVAEIRQMIKHHDRLLE